MKKLLAAAVMALSFCSIALCATVASDNASNAAYSDGWATGDNGGTGFGTWTLTQSGGGNKGSYIGGTALGATTFGLFAANDSTAFSSADRPFTGGALASGQSFSVSVANTSRNFGEIGLQFLSGTTVRWTLKLVSGAATWRMNDGGSDFNIAQNFQANTALNLNFTYNGGNSYSYTFGSASGNNFVASSDLSNLTGVRFYNRDQGNGENFGFNDLSVVPEPSTYALLAITAVGFGAHVLRLRRRTCK
jgi:hypothetical protein